MARTGGWPVNRARYAATANRNTGGVVTTTPETAGSARGISPCHQCPTAEPTPSTPPTRGSSTPVGCGVHDGDAGRLRPRRPVRMTARPPPHARLGQGGQPRSRPASDFACKRSLTGTPMFVGGRTYWKPPFYCLPFANELAVRVTTHVKRTLIGTTARSAADETRDP